MRAFVVTTSLAIFALQTAEPVLAGSAADEIAEKFARASDPSPAKAMPDTPPPASAAKDDTAERARLEAEREAETLHLAERLRAARKAKAEALDREEREQQAAEAAKAAAPATAQAAVCPPAEHAKPAAPATAPLTLTTLPTANSDTAPAAILLSLDPGTYGIRRFNPASADPVLCIGETCYISQGSTRPAKALPKTIALGAGNTLGARAGACRQKLACIFRNVPLPSPNVELQPVDLHILRHDRREVAAATPDASCRVAAGRLACGTVVRSATYRAIIVPEQIAQSAGGVALEAALPVTAAAKTAAVNINN